ncbi:MAG: Uma2 family endonuclease [Spirochaetaceae bacterium]|nr:Uma2 family endonuclease [Spirochaetaceae bacterium]
MRTFPAICYTIKGVKEYWVVDPGNEYIRVFQLKEGNMIMAL